jgi:3-hydroxybutyryl-CoA dehydrogenase
LVETDLLEEKETSSILKRITFTNSILEVVKNADLVIETVGEDVKVKKKVYELLDETCSMGTIFLSNTSSLNIFNLVDESRLPSTAIAHWFAPPHIIPLVEVIRGPKTKDSTVDLTVTFLKKLKKITIVMEKFIPGFAINRIQRNLGREIFFLIENGYITVEQLDLAVKASIAPRMMVLGVVQRYDFTGLDLSTKHYQIKAYFDPPIDNRPKALFRRVEKGHLGVKAGKGFYDYENRKSEEILRDRDIYLLRVFKELSFCLEKERLV